MRGPSQGTEGTIVVKINVLGQMYRLPGRTFFVGRIAGRQDSFKMDCADLYASAGVGAS